MVHPCYSLKILIVFSLLPAFSASFAQGTWERINVPTNQYLKSVCFTDSLYGWIAGDSGTILHTTDGGKTWNFQDTHGIYDVEDVYFLDRNQGWASSVNYTTVPYGTILLKTTDGGASWVSQTYPVNDIFITCILFRDPMNGWMGGRPHALVKTTDGGLTWTQAAIDTSTLAFFPVLSILFYNDQYGYASGGMFDIAGVTWRTSNGGEMWYAIDPSQAPADEVHGLHMFDSIHVMGAGGDPDFGYGVGMIRTSDGGVNWTYDELTIQGNAYDLDFRNDHEAWAPLGPRRKLIYSMDAGVTWTAIDPPDSSAIYDMIFPDSLHGFAVGKEGVVLKYFPPVIPSVPSIQQPQQGYTLYQNNPNPVHEGTTIRFSVPSDGTAPGIIKGNPSAQYFLIVYNVFGQEVARHAAGNLSGGGHEFEFGASELQDGIYLYMLHRIGSGQNQVVAGPKRMIIMKI